MQAAPLGRDGAREVIVFEAPAGAEEQGRTGLLKQGCSKR